MVSNEPDNQGQPRQVFLFSGHMIDAPTRPKPRFPAAKEPAAARKIAEALEQLGAGPEDLALTQGACGGDLLFTEACQQRGVKVQWLQPFDESEFIQKSVVCHSETWRARYLAAKAKLTTEIRSAPQDLGPLPQGAIPMSVATSGSSRLPFLMEPIRFNLSVSGTVAAATDRVAPRTCIRK